MVGASGFLGVHIVRGLSERGHRVIGVVRSPRGARRVAEAGGAPRRAALADTGGLARVLRRAQAAIHLAGTTRETPGGSFGEVHIEGTRSIIDACRRAGVPRLLYVSGLGTLSLGRNPRVANRYFTSKRLAEALVLGSGLDAAVFRPGYIIGPRDRMVGVLARQMAGRGNVTLRGRGDYRLQPLYIGDFARMVESWLRRRPPWREYDAVGPRVVSYLEFLGLVETALRERGDLRRRVRYRRVPLDHPGGLSREEMDILTCGETAASRPAARDLGVRPTPLGEAIRWSLPSP